MLLNVHIRLSGLTALGEMELSIPPGGYFSVESVFLSLLPFFLPYVSVVTPSRLEGLEDNPMAVQCTLIL